MTTRSKFEADNKVAYDMYDVLYESGLLFENPNLKTPAKMKTRSKEQQRLKVAEYCAGLTTPLSSSSVSASPDSSPPVPGVVAFKTDLSAVCDDDLQSPESSCGKFSTKITKKHSATLPSPPPSPLAGAAPSPKLFTSATHPQKPPGLSLVEWLMPNYGNLEDPPTPPSSDVGNSPDTQLGGNTVSVDLSSLRPGTLFGGAVDLTEE